MKKWKPILLGTVSILALAGVGLGIKACQDKKNKNKNLNNNNFIQSRASGFLYNHWTENIPGADFQDKVLNITVNINISNPDKEKPEWTVGNVKLAQTTPNPWATDNEIKRTMLNNQQIKAQVQEQIESQIGAYLQRYYGTYNYNWDNRYLPYNWASSSINFDTFWKNYVNDINLENNVEFGIKREVVIRTGHGRASADKFHQYINSIKINKEITIQIKLRPKSRQKAFEYFKKELSKFIERGKNVQLITDYNHDKIDDYKLLEPEYEQFKTNRQYFKEWAKKLDLSFSYENFTWKISYKLDESKKFINIYMVNTSNDEKFILIENQGFDFKKSNKLEKLGIINKLRLSETQKYLAFDQINNNNPTGMANDKPERIANDKKIGLEGQNYYLGTYKLHAPAVFSFTAPNDNYVVKVNGHKVDLINNKFNIKLADKREDASDEQKIYNQDSDSSKPQDEKNSHKKNEYTITVEEYKNINDPSTKTITYTKKYIIDSKSGSLDFKWYAWDPKYNKDQRELIEEYLKDEKGNIQKDKDGNPLPNPKYDPFIDKKTGTKKELVWFDTTNWSSNYQAYNLGTLNLSNNSFEYIYARTTGLPFFAYTLFNSKGDKIRDKGFIAEATIISKAALKMLAGKTEEYYIIKIDNKSKNWENPEKLDNFVSGDSYLSNEGTYLLYSRSSKDSINNFKILKISNEQTINKKMFSEINKIDSIKNLWKTTTGYFFAKFLNEKHNISLDELDKLKYEEVQIYWNLYITYLANKNQENIYITPRLDFSSESNKFKDKTEFLEYLKQNNIDIIDKYGKFENKELVGIEKYNFIDNNQLEITYNLKTADDRYRLTVLKQTYLINFINDKTNKTEIFLQWNKELIKEKIRNNSEYRFFKWLFSSFTSAITNKESEKQVLNFNYAYFDNKWLTIYAELKKEYADKYYLTNNEFKIEAIFKPVDLFDDRFEPKMINLKGETREEQIKQIITLEIKKQIIQFFKKFDIDISENDIKIQEITSEIVQKLKNVYKTKEIALNNATKLNVDINNKTHNIKAKTTFEIINFSDTYVSNIIDLSKLKLDPIDINYDVSFSDKKEYQAKWNAMANLVKIEIQKQLNSLNPELVLNKNVIYNEEEFENVITNLFYKDIISTLNIFPNHPMIKNSTSIEITNGHETTQKFNFGDLELDDLNIKSKNYTEIKKLIIQWVDSQIRSKLYITNLAYEKDYLIEELNNIDYMKTLISKKGKNELTLTIKPVNKSYEGETKLKVINDFDGNLSEEDKKTWEKPDENIYITPRLDFSSESNKFKDKTEFLEYLKQNNIDIIDKYGKFENKELVGIEKYNFIDNNQLEITYNLKTADDRYRLTVLKQTYLINFINDKTNKTEIFLQWNKELIKEKIRNNSEYRFFKWLFSSFTSAITNKESEKQVLNFNYAYFDNKWLTIYAELKKEYADKYYLTNNEFKIEAIFKPVDLFDDRFEPKMINLKGETREEQIKQIITLEIKKQIIQFFKKFDIDISENDIKIQEITSEIVQKLKNVYKTKEIALNNATKLNVDINNKTHNIKAKTTFEIINFSDTYVSNIIDLSKLKLDPIDINYDVSFSDKKEYQAKWNAMANLVKIEIQKQLNSLNPELVLNKNVIYNEEEFENVITNLFYKDIISTLNIFPNHPMIKNSTSIEITNGHETTQKFNFGDLELDDLNIKSKNYTEIKKLIIQWVDSQIKSKLFITNLAYEKDYLIEELNNIDYIKALISKKGKNELTLTIKPSNDSCEGETKLKVINDFDGDLSKTEDKRWKQKPKLNALSIGLITTFSLLGFIGLIIPLIILIYRKKSAKIK